eukprot:403341040
MSINVRQVKSGDCFELKPVISGGSVGNTQYSTLHKDSSSNIAIGGSSSDTSLVSATSTPNAFVLFVMSAGVAKWVRTFDTIYNDVTSIAVQYGDEKIIAALDSSVGKPQALVILYSTDGSLYKSLKLAAAQMKISPDGMQAYSSGELVAVFQYLDKTLGIMKLMTGNSFPLTTSQFKLLDQPIAATSQAKVLLSQTCNSNIYFYVGGFATISTVKYPSLMQFTYSAGLSTSLGIKHPSNDYVINHLAFRREDSSNNYLWFSAEGSTDLIIGYNKMSSNCNLRNSDYIMRQVSQFQKCLQISVKDENEVYYLFYKTNKIFVGILKEDESNRKYEYKEGVALEVSVNNVFFHAITQSGNDFYFVGTVDKLSTTYNYAPIQVGYLMLTSSTGPITFSSSSQTTDPAYVFDIITSTTSFGFATLSSVITSEIWYDAGITATAMTNSLTQISTLTTYTITGTISDKSYTVNSGTQTHQFNEFSIDTSCSDLSVLYEVTSTLPSFVTFYESNRTFVINTAVETNVNTYTITVKGTINNEQSLTKSFVLTVVSQCASATLTAAAYSTINYVVAAASSTATLNAFTVSNSNCGVTYTFTNSDGTTHDGSLITNFDSTTRVVTYYTNLESKVGTHTFTVTGKFTYYPTKTATQTLTIIVTSQCFTDVITATSITSPQNYYWNIGTSITLVSALSWSQSKSGTCPAIVYTAVNSSTGAALDSIFTFSANTLTLQTSDSAKAGTYTIRITGTTTSTGGTLYKTVSTTFIVIIDNQCSSAVLTTQTPGDQTYVIGNAQSTFSFTDWTSSISGCGPFVYTATYNNGSTVGTPFTFTSSTKAFTVGLTTNLNYASSYTINLKGQLTTGSVSQTITFIVTITDPCITATITPAQTITTPKVIKVTEAGGSVTFTEFVTNVASQTLCGSWNYLVTGSGGGSLDSVFTYTSGTKTIAYSTNDPAKGGNTYTVQIKGYQGTYTSRSYSLTFDVQVVLDCTFQTSTNPADSSSNYQISQTSKTINPGAFTYLISTTYCPIQYECKFSNNTDCTGIFTINPSTGIITAYSTTSGLGATYPLSIKAFVTVSATKYYTNANPVVVTVTVTEQCQLGMPATTLSASYSYSIYSPVLNIPYDDFTFSATAGCGTLSYEVRVGSSTGTLLSASTIPNLITHNSGGKKFQVQSSDNNFASQTYSIYLVGLLTDGGGTVVATNYQNFNLIVGTVCLVASLVSPDSLSDISQKLLADKTSVSFSDFTQVDSCGLTVTYVVSVDSYITLPTFINATQLATAPYGIDIWSQSSTDVSNSPYTVKITATVTNADGSIITGYTSFQVTFSNQNKAAPKFMPTLKDISMTVGDEYSLTIPDPVDMDGDGFEIASIKFSPTPAFISGTYPSYSLSPSAGTDVGDFKCTIIVTDDNSNPMSATYTFTIKVKAAAVSNNTTLNYTVGQNSTKVDQPKIVNTTSTSFTAYIKQISIQGSMTVLFSSEAMVPANYSSFNNSIMLITIRNSEGIIDKTINFTWEIKDFTSKGMRIQLTFDDPGKVSKYDKNSIQIVFLQNGYFLEKSTGSAIAIKYTTKKDSPKQLRKDSATAALTSNGGSGAGALSSMMYGSMAMNVVMAASLSLLWGMINVLQLIINMPLMNVDFPMNAIYFYTLLMDMANFDLLPSQEVESNMFEFEETSNLANFLTPSRYQSSNVVQNLGSMFLYLVGLVAAIVVVLLMKQWAKKNAKVKKVYDFLANRLLYNMPLRMFLEGFMAFFINSTLNMYYLDWSSNSSRFSSAFAVMLVFSSMTFPFVILFLLFRNQKKLEQIETKNSYGALYAELKTYHKIPLLFNVFYVGRRIIFAGVALICINIPFVQIQTLILSSMVVITYLGASKPFENMFNTKLEIFNEICILGAAYHLITLTDYQPDPDMQYSAGWSLVALTVFNMLVNIIIMVSISLVNLVKKFKVCKAKLMRWCRNRKMKKESNYKVEQFDSTLYQALHNDSRLNDTTKTKTMSSNQLQIYDDEMDVSKYNAKQSQVNLAVIKQNSGSGKIDTVDFDQIDILQQTNSQFNPSPTSSIKKKKFTSKTAKRDFKSMGIRKQSMNETNDDLFQNQNAKNQGKINLNQKSKLANTNRRNSIFSNQEKMFDFIPDLQDLQIGNIRTNGGEGDVSQQFIDAYNKRQKDLLQMYAHEQKIDRNKNSALNSPKKKAGSPSLNFALNDPQNFQPSTFTKRPFKMKQYSQALKEITLDDTQDLANVSGIFKLNKNSSFEDSSPKKAINKSKKLGNKKNTTINQTLNTIIPNQNQMDGFSKTFDESNDFFKGHNAFSSLPQKSNKKQEIILENYDIGNDEIKMIPAFNRNKHLPANNFMSNQNDYDVSSSIEVHTGQLQQQADNMKIKTKGKRGTSQPSIFKKVGKKGAKKTTL